MAQREQDLYSMRSMDSGDLHSQRDASLLKKEHELDERSGELLEQAKMLAERVSATNAVLDAVHARLVDLARTAGVTVGPQDDREVRGLALAAG